jgi:hypothetical protein
MSGTTAMNATTSPEPTVCSAYAVHPMPPPSISVPTMAAWRHCLASGHAAPRQRIHAISTTPAKRKRVPIWKKGGKLSSAYLMARYVEPQTSHVAARHSSRRPDSGGAAGVARVGARELMARIV